MVEDGAVRLYMLPDGLAPCASILDGRLVDVYGLSTVTVEWRGPVTVALSAAPVVALGRGLRVYPVHVMVGPGVARVGDIEVYAGGSCTACVGGECAECSMVGGECDPRLLAYAAAAAALSAALSEA
jgi:hypothetical protein